MGLLQKKKTFFCTGTLVRECCDNIPFCNIGRLHKGFFSLSQGVCACVFFLSEDCTVKGEGKKERERRTKRWTGPKKKVESSVLSMGFMILQKNHSTTLLEKLKN